LRRSSVSGGGNRRRSGQRSDCGAFLADALLKIAAANGHGDQSPQRNVADDEWNSSFEDGGEGDGAKLSIFRMPRADGDEQKKDEEAV